MSQTPMNLPFEQLASYDKPSLLLTMALDNELTLRGGMQALVDSNGLSPKERDLVTTRLKDKVGRNPITDSAIDIITNPFVLLMAVTSPVAGQMLSRSGKAIFDMGARYSPFIKEQGGLHAALGALSPMQLFRGTALTPAMESFTKGVDNMEQEMVGVVGGPLQRVLERHGLESLNPDKISDPIKKELARDLNTTLWASMEGMDKVRREALPVMKTVDNEGIKTIELEMVNKEIPQYVNSNMNMEIERRGLTELRDAMNKAKADRRMALFGDADKSFKSGTFVADEQKLLRQIQGVKMGFSNEGALRGTGAEVTAMLMGPEISELISSGQIEAEAISKFLKEIIEKQPADYMPRNLVDLVGETSMTKVLEQRRSRGLAATGSTLGRSSVSGSFHPEDLEDVFKRFGSTEEGGTLLENSKTKIRKIVEGGGSAKTYRINAQESLARYFRDTAVTHALYVQTVDQMPHLGQAIQDTRGFAKPEKVKALEGAMFQSELMDKSKQSLASVLQEEHYLLEDRFAKEAVEVLLRQAMGVQKIEHAATHMALINGKRGMQAVLESPIGKALKGSGSWGEGMYNRMDELVKKEMTFGESKSMSASLAKYFYVTHLGFNLSSAAMNMMQPLLLASTWGGLGNVAKAYGTAFKELGGYLKERVGKHGFTSLSDVEHMALIQKHFKYSNVEGENLLGIGRDSFATLDSISYKSDALSGLSRRESYFYDYPMKLFEKVEWLNRSVAAHTVENMYTKAGIDTTRGGAGYYRMNRDVGEMVSGSQFGGSSLNTPMMFQGVGPAGRLGNNPLARQFLGFPLRSLTALTHDAPKLGERGPVKGITQDLIRGMGISAIFYELGKNSFNMDISPGLYGSSLTQIVGGDRFYQSGNEYVPIPPVIDIPMNLIRGAMDPGQRELLANNLPRLIPGGISFSRALAMSPKLGGDPLFGLPGSLQKTYVDFKQRTPDGQVAVYKADGTLIDYQSPGKIFAKYMGLDMGTFRNTSDFDGFMLKNREQIVEYRRKAIAALLSNEIPKMQSIKGEYKKRFGMDLTISKAQLDEAMKNRLVSRSERIMDRMPPELKGQYQQLAAGRADQMGVPSEAIIGADTARQRMQARAIQTLPLTQEQRQVMSQETGKPFESFGGY